MSHFSVAVFSKMPGYVEALLAPFEENDRHAVVDEADAVGGFAGEDGEARQGSRLGLCVEAAEIEELLAPGPDGVFHLAVRAALPLEVAARRDEAAAQLCALAEKLLLPRCLAPRVYDEAAALSLKAPAHREHSRLQLSCF